MNGIRIPETNGFNSMEADGVEQDNTDDDLDDEATHALMELLAALGEHSVEYVARWVASAQMVAAVPGIGASPIDSWREGSMLMARQACKPNHARAASSCNTSWVSCSR